MGIPSFDDLKAWIAELDEYLKQFSIEPVAGHLASIWTTRASELKEKFGLESPTKQTFFLMGLLMNSPEPSTVREMGDRELQHASALLNKIYDYYSLQYFKPKIGEARSPEKVHQESLAMPMFLDYLNNARVMGSYEQMIRKIELNFVPLDQELEQLVGISATTALEILGWIWNDLQGKLNQLVPTCATAMEASEEWARLKRTGQKEKAEAFVLANEAAGQQYAKLMTDLHVVRKLELANRFGIDKANAFWKLAVSIRGQESKLSDPLSPNIAEQKALFQFEEGAAYCIVSNTVASGIAEQFHDLLTKSKVSQRYYSNRDKALESEGTKVLTEFYETQPVIFESAFERPDAQFEHDLLLLDGDTLLVVEAKASQIRPPFRDSDKTYVRMQGWFSGDNGIQKAYDQANRIRAKLLLGNDVTLYTKKGEVKGILEHSKINRIFLICLTAERQACLATDLSFFLEKEDSEPYPWAVNIHDLELFLEGITARGWKADRFYQYLEERSPLHGIVKTNDELEFAGYYLLNDGLGGLHKSLRPNCIMMLEHFCWIFDDIWKAKNGGAPVNFRPGSAVTDVRKALAERSDSEAYGQAIEQRAKIGRNEICPLCASGKKYKHCCLRA